MVVHDMADEKDIPLDIVLSDKDIPDEPPFRAYVEAKVYDKEGHIIQYHRQPMRSLTQYFLGFMAIALLGTYASSTATTAPPIFTSLTNIPSQLSSSFPTYFMWTASIQVGSGTQSFSPTLNSLSEPIPNGTGAGQLYYGNVSVSYTSTSIFVSVTVFNNSGSTINVTEIGLFGTAGFINISTTYTFLLSYDTFSTAISIPNGSLATFQITLTFSG